MIEPTPMVGLIMIATSVVVLIGAVTLLVRSTPSGRHKAARPRLTPRRPVVGDADIEIPVAPAQAADRATSAAPLETRPVEPRPAEDVDSTQQDADSRAAARDVVARQWRQDLVLIRAYALHDVDNLLEALSHIDAGSPEIALSHARRVVIDELGLDLDVFDDMSATEPRRPLHWSASA